MSAAAPADIPPAAPPPRRRRSRWMRALVALVVVVVALVVAIAIAAYWLLATPGGAQFVFQHVTGALGKGTRIEGVQGAIGGPLAIRLVEIDRPDLYVRVDDVDMDTTLAAIGTRLDVRRLHAKSVEVRTFSTGAAATLPASLKPPYPVRLEDGRIATFRQGVISAEEKAATDPAVKAKLREAARAKDVVLHDIVVQGEGDRRRWTVTHAGVVTEYGAAHVKGTIGNAAPFEVDVAADFAGKLQERALKVAARAKGTLKSFEANVEADLNGTRADARATVEPFANAPLQALQVATHGLDLAQVQAGLPTTRLDVGVQLKPDGKSFTGPVLIRNAAPAPWDQHGLPFATAGARVVLDPQGRADVTGLQLVLLGGGSVSGTAGIAKDGMKADLTLADVDLAALHGALQKTQVSGTLGVAGDSNAQRFTAALKDPRFEIEGNAALAAQRLDVETVTVRTGGGSVTAKGGMALAGRKDFRFEGRAQHFDPAAFVKTAAGDLNFTFVASGDLANGPAGEAKVDIAPSKYAGQAASGHVAVAGNKDRVARADVQLALGDARITARGSFGRAGDAMDVTLHAPNLSALAQPFDVAAGGSVDAQARLTGTFQAPAGSVSLTAANLRLPSDVYVKDAALRAQAGSAADSPLELALTVHGVVLGKDQPPTPFAQALDVSLKGTRASHQLNVVAKMNDEATLTTAVSGGLDEHGSALAWNGRVESLALTGRGAFALTGPATLTASAERVELGDATLRGTWGSARFQQTRWTPTTLDVQGSSPAIEIQNLARSLRLGNAARSTLVVAGEWSVHAAESFDGSVNFHRLSGDVRAGDPPLAPGLTDLVVRADVVKGRAHAQVQVAGSRIGKVQGEGTALIQRGTTGWELARDAPVDAHLTASVPDLATFASWIGPDAKAGGKLEANVNVSGTGAAPRIAGTVRAADLQLREPVSGFELERGQVALRLDGRSLAIERFTAQAPWHPSPAAAEKLDGTKDHAPGTIEAQGSLDMETHTGAITIKLAAFPVTQLPARFVALSGDARLEATNEGVLASGTFKADAGWVGALETPPPSPSEDVVVVRAAQPAPAETKQGERIQVDAKFDLGDQLYFQGRGLDTRLAGSLALTGEVPTLKAVGTVRTVGGTYKGYGQKLDIERGVLQFEGPIDNPQLNVRAIRKGLPVEAGVEVLGSASYLRVRLVSTPDVPEPEKLSWLVLGRGPSELTAGDASLLVTAASSMLGKDPGEDFTKKIGLDEVKIGRADNTALGVLPQSTVAGRTATASAAEVVTVGKAITRVVHVSYEQGLSDAEGTLKVVWKITQRFSVLGRAGYLPGIDGVWRWAFE
jgi:translocation and assembly module TamB